MILRFQRMGVASCQSKLLRIFCVKVMSLSCWFSLLENKTQLQFTSALNIHKVVPPTMQACFSYTVN